MSNRKESDDGIIIRSRENRRQLHGQESDVSFDLHNRHQGSLMENEESIPGRRRIEQRRDIELSCTKNSKFCSQKNSQHDTRPTLGVGRYERSPSDGKEATGVIFE